MRKILFLSVFIIRASLFTYGQATSSEFDHEGQIESSGLKFVVRNGKCGYVDANGKEIVPIIYDYEKGDFNVYKNDALGLNPKYGYIERWTNSTIIVRVKKDGKYGFVNHKGEVVIPLKYDMLYNWGFSRYDKLARARIGDKYGLVDIGGREVVPVMYKETGTCGDYDNWAWVQRSDGKIAFVDWDGSFITDFKYTETSQHYLSSETRACVAVNGLWGLVNKNGNEIISPKYKCVVDFQSGYAGVVKDNKLGFIDMNENTVIPYIYDVVIDYGNVLRCSFNFAGIANVRKDGKWGLINKQGTAITPFKYDKCEPPSNRMDIDMPIGEAKVAGKTVYLDILGNEYETKEELNKSSVTVLETAANQGIPIAAECLSEMYISGKGVPKDTIKSFEWCKKAVELGYTGAEYSLARKYYYGIGCENNHKNAFSLFKSAADRGVRYAYLFLGWMYYYGQGTEKDYENSFKYFYKSAQSCNDYQSEYYLAWQYEHGQGTTINIKEAKKWYAESAFHNYQPAKDKLAELDRDSKPNPTPVNNIASITWLVYESTTKQKNYTFKLGIKSDSKIEDVSVSVNGTLTRGILPVKADGNDMTLERTVELNEGKNIIKVTVTNAGGIATSEKTVTYQNQSIPTIDWIAFTPSTTDKQYALKAGIKSNSKIESSIVTLNGIIDKGINPIKDEGYNMMIDKKFTLAEGENSIKIEVTNASGTAVSEKKITRIVEDVVVREKRLALVIGNAAYSGLCFPKLNNTRNDAQVMYSKIQSLGFDMMPIVLDASRTQMWNAIEDFVNKIKRDKYEVALIYYSGHGLSPYGGANYLIPVNADIKYLDEVERDGINSQTDLIEKLEKAQCRVKIALLDCCNNCNVPERGAKSAANQGGLREMKPTHGLSILHAAQPRQTAIDGLNGSKNSPFVEAFVECVSKYADSRWSTFVDELTNIVDIKTEGRQIPYPEGQLRGKPFYLNPNHK